jgi:hypothetical protein
VRLFCFLWTGGCASFFGQLQSLFAESPIELVPINLPGRDKDAETQPALSWAEAITKLADALCDGWVQSMPFAFFGHSLGAWTAIETIHELRDRGLPLPLHLFVSAKFAPQLSADERAHALSQFRARGGLGASSDLGSAEAPKVASAETEVNYADCFLRSQVPYVKRLFTKTDSGQHREHSKKGRAHRSSGRLTTCTVWSRGSQTRHSFVPPSRRSFEQTCACPRATPEERGSVRCRD